MNANQENRRSSYYSLGGVLRQNENVWQSNAAFATSVADFRSGVKTIDSLVQATSTGTKGVTETKHVARVAMSTTTLELAGALCAFASRTGNTELLAKVDLTETDLTRLRDGEVGSTCQAVHDLVAEHLEDLADAQVTDVELKALQDRIDDYNGYAGKTRQKRTENTAAVGQLDVAFETTDKVLDEQLDKRMLKFKAVAPDFFRAYMAARKVVDNAASHNGKNGDSQPPQPPQ
jgi:hypothetical protein